LVVPGTQSSPELVHSHVCIPKRFVTAERIVPTDELAAGGPLQSLCISRLLTDGVIETRVTQRRLATNAQVASVDVFDPRWRLKDNGKVVYRPYSDSSGVPEDLQVGKSWSFKFESVRKGAAQTQEFAGVGKVEAWERVALPSGSAYDAFKIDVAAAPRSAPAGRKVELHAMMWFAPAVNRVVKRVDESRVDGKLRDASEQTLRAYKPAAKI